MKRHGMLATFIAAIAVGFAFVGFQCSSAELTSAKLYIQRNEYDKAEEQLLKDVTNNPQDEEGWYFLGRVRAERKNWTGMLDAFDHALKISDAHKKDITLYREHFWVQFYNEGTKELQNARSDSTGYGKAIESFNTAILMEPDSDMAYQGLAYTYLNMGNTDSAIAPLKKVWDSSKNEDAAKYLGEIYFENGVKLKQDFENENGDKLTNIKNINSIDKGQSLSDVASTLGQPDEKNTPEQPKQKGKRKVTPGPQVEKWVYKTLGLTLTFEDGNLKDKHVDFAYNPNIDSTKYKLALVQFQNALDVLIPAAKLYPEDQSLTTEMTNCYIASNQTQEATETFRAAAEKNPDNSEFQYNYGVILLKAGKYEKAVGQFEKATAAGTKALEQINKDLAAAEGGTDQAKVSDLRSDSTRIAATEWNSMYNLGASYVNWGVEIQNSASPNSDPDSLRKAVTAKFQEGLPYLEKYSTYKSDDPNLWELLARVYAYTNDVKKAQDAIQRSDSLRQAH